MGIDSDKSCWVVPEMLENMSLCISEKRRVIDRSKYAEWWLILVDFTGLGFNDNDYKSLREATSLGYSFDRILMIKPYDYSRAFEFYP